MQHNAEYWWMRYVKMKVKYAFLLKNWQALLVKEIEQERGMLERDKVIVALQAKVRELTR